MVRVTVAKKKNCFWLIPYIYMYLIKQVHEVRFQAECRHSNRTDLALMVYISNSYEKLGPDFLIFQKAQGANEVYFEDTSETPFWGVNHFSSPGGGSLIQIIKKNLSM